MQTANESIAGCRNGIHVYPLLMDRKVLHYFRYLILAAMQQSFSVHHLSKLYNNHIYHLNVFKYNMFNVTDRLNPLKILETNV